MCQVCELDKECIECGTTLVTLTNDEKACTNEKCGMFNPSNFVLLYDEIEALDEFVNSVWLSKGSR
jgi:hypothetical protein